MSFTKRTTLDDTYVALTAADATGIAQVQGNDAVRLHLGDSAPSNDTEDYITIWDDGLAEFPFLNAETGDILYARAAGDSAVVVVAATGSAPV